MKVKLVETLVKEAIVDVPDDVTSIVEVFKMSGEKADSGEAEFSEAKSVGKTIVEVTSDKDELLMTQQMGRTLFTAQGAKLFDETKDTESAKELGERVAAQAEEGQKDG